MRDIACRANVGNGISSRILPIAFAHAFTTRNPFNASDNQVVQSLTIQIVLYRKDFITEKMAACSGDFTERLMHLVQTTTMVTIIEPMMRALSSWTGSSG